MRKYVSAILLSAAASAAGAPAADDRLVLLDGQSVRGTVEAIDSGGRVRLAGRPEPLDLQGLRAIERPVSPPRAAQAPSEVFFFDGGQVRAADVALDGQILRVRWAYGDLRLPLGAVAAIRLGTLPGEGPDVRPPEFDQARADPQVRRDHLLAIVATRIQVVRGAVQKIDSKDVFFIWDQEERRIARPKVYGLVLARAGLRPGEAALRPAGASQSSSEAGPAPDLAGRCLVAFEDGSSVWMEVAGLSGGRLVGRAAGTDLAVPWAAVRGLRVRSTRLVFLSDLDPVEVEEEPLVTFGGPWQRDRSVVGGPLKVGSTVYEKGLGVHSRTRLVYEVGGRFDTFAAVLGLDSSADGRGDCVFQVLADGRELFAKRVRGSDPPHAVRLPVRGAARLTLLVDWGEDLDLADRADWCDARLLRD